MLSKGDRKRKNLKIYIQARVKNARKQESAGLMRIFLRYAR